MHRNASGLYTRFGRFTRRPVLACQMAEAAEGKPAYNRFKRMEAAWLALAEEQDWLDGERSPVGSDQGLAAEGEGK
jgi:hypothetical protein